MEKWHLGADESASVRALLGELSARFDSVEDPVFLRSATTYAHQLPAGLRARLNVFRLAETSGAVLISGLPVDDEAIGPTPSHWRTRPDRSPALGEELFFVLCGSLLGDLIGWSTQQGGHLVHDVLPIKGDETKQLSSASQALITWHVEDAFHPYRADYIGLMCLRNPDGTGTTYASIDDVELDDELMDVLFQPRYTISPDESHELAEASELERIPVLFGARDHPYVRMDPYFMDRSGLDPAARAALDRLMAAVDAQLRAVVLRPGDVLLIDNYRVLHGRNPFEARYDGRDRWLKRINLARDLRKSRAARLDAESRIIH